MVQSPELREARSAVDRECRRERTQVWLSIAAAILFAAGIVAAVVLPGQARARELAGTSLQTGTGVVTSRSYEKGLSRTGGSGAYHLVSLGLDGRPVDVRDLDNFGAPELKVGQRVRFTYLSGRSGWWHIQSIQPEQQTQRMGQDS